MGAEIYLADEQGDKLINRYLLGDLSDEECERLEERFFADDQHFSQMLDSEDELLDSYVGGGMPEPDRQRFEEQLLKTPRARQRLEVYRMLLRLTPDGPSLGNGNVKAHITTPGWLRYLIPKRPPRRALQYALVVLLVALLAGAAWLFYRSSAVGNESRNAVVRQSPAPPEQIPPSQVNEQQARDQELRTGERDGQGQAQETQPFKPIGPGESARKIQPRARTTQLSAAVPTIRLVAGISRGSEAAPSLVIPPNVKFVRLVLNVGDEAKASNRAVLLKNNREEIWRVSQLTISPGGGKAMTLQPPARLLTPGGYILKLQRVTGDTVADLDYYYFRVNR